MIQKLIEKWADAYLKKRIREIEEENRRLQAKLEEYTLFVEKALEKLKKDEEEKERREQEVKMKKIEEMEKIMKQTELSWEENKKNEEEN